ncbi:beta-phosphoglucomutase [Clostridia bacterium]|nr:beta-phosphoglucomutase [Clostridia bacterium]GHU89844.1 beta-phosphoglucomutase [Clostridia bacterium]
MRIYKGVIFDLDGVICHTDKYHYQAWKALADRLGVAFDEVKNNRLRGVSRMESLAIVLEDYGKPLTDAEKTALASEKNAQYVRLLQDMTPADLPDEVSGTLKTLKNAELKLAIGSSSRNARLILERIGLGTFFDAISDGNNITRSKPDPEVFLKAAGFIGLTPSDCLVVEDAKAGIEAAAAGGFDSAGIGDARDLAKYPLGTFADLTEVTANG